MNESTQSAEVKTTDDGHVRLNVVLACRNSSGAPDFAVVPVMATDSEYALGYYYDMAQWAAEDAGYQGPFVAFDPAEFGAIFKIAEQLRPTAGGQSA
ncbi:MAG: hypothetical protein E7K47_05305 [Acidovorax sp.]|nr:hypothetical protein [Acidovorax sp.]